MCDCCDGDDEQGIPCPSTCGALNLEHYATLKYKFLETYRAHTTSYSRAIEAETTRVTIIESSVKKLGEQLERVEALERAILMHKSYEFNKKSSAWPRINYAMVASGMRMDERKKKYNVFAIANGEEESEFIQRVLSVSSEKVLIGEQLNENENENKYNRHALQPFTLDDFLTVVGAPLSDPRRKYHVTTARQSPMLLAGFFDRPKESLLMVWGVVLFGLPRAGWEVWTWVRGEIEGVGMEIEKEEKEEKEEEAEKAEEWLRTKLVSVHPSLDYLSYAPVRKIIIKFRMLKKDTLPTLLFLWESPKNSFLWAKKLAVGIFVGPDTYEWKLLEKAEVEAAVQITNIKNKLKLSANKLDVDYGPRNVYSTAADVCYSSKVGSYNYEVCLLGRVSQGKTTLGR